MPALSGIAFILLLFACVVAHEFGHVLTARRYGIQTRDITLLPIGGVARLERMPREPVQELWVALAGPAVNVVIAGVVYALILLFEGASALINVRVVGGDLLSKLMWVNVVLVLFNLLPAFPMDGGRVLRALLARRMEYGQATRIAATIGQTMAFLFGLLGLFTNPFLLFIALFVYMGAEAEAQMVKAQTAFRGLPVREAMVTRFVTLPSAAPLIYALDLLLSGTQQDFPIVDDGHMVGVLTHRDLLSALQEHGPQALVADAKRSFPSPVRADDPLEEVFQRLQREEIVAIPVVEGKCLVGLVTLQNVLKLLMVRAVLQGAFTKGGAPPERAVAAGKPVVIEKW